MVERGERVQEPLWWFGGLSSTGARPEGLHDTVEHLVFLPLEQRLRFRNSDAK